MPNPTRRLRRPEWAERLYASRVMSGRTQADLSAAIGISQPRYANYEAGIREPDFETLVKLSDALNVQIDFLLKGSK
jgi:transcriptional regulator with XRE-family HTH domain